MKVFLDANVLFSASDEKSATRRLLELILQHNDVVTSPHAWEEARRNLKTKRPQNLPGLIALEAEVATTHAFRMPDGVALTDKDEPILAGAVGAKCTHLWTGDRTHFGALYGQTLRGVKIVSSVMMADEVGA